MKPANSNHKFIPDKKLALTNTIEEKLKAGKKSNALYLNNLFLTILPEQVFSMGRVTVLDLGFNNIEILPEQIGGFAFLEQLYLNDNPLGFVPVQLSKCKSLKVLILNNTYIKYLPREIAKLRNIYKLEMKNCPLAGNIKDAYEIGLENLFSYLRRKLERSEYREMIVKHLKEWIYTSSSYDEIQIIIQKVLDNMKEATTNDLKRLLRNIQNIFPLRITDVDPEEIKKKLYTKHAVKKIKKEDLFVDPNDY